MGVVFSLCVFSRLLASLSALLSCTLIISLVFAIIPLCHQVVLLSVAMALAGTSMGVIDTIANLQLVKLYQKDSAVFLQVSGDVGGEGTNSCEYVLCTVC